MSKDLFNNKKPVQIEVGEWWYNGRIIQKQDHPLLPKYISFEDNETSCIVNQHHTKKEAVNYCYDNPCKKPQRLVKDYL